MRDEVFTAIRKYMPDNSVLIQQAGVAQPPQGGAPKGVVNSPNGRKGKSKEEGINCADGTVNSKGHGTNALTTRARRLNRDHPEVAERVAKGEMSILEAEREVGIERENRTMWIPKDAKKLCEKLAERFGQELLDELVAAHLADNHKERTP